MLNKNPLKRGVLKYCLSVPLFVAVFILSAAAVNNCKVVKTITQKSIQDTVDKHSPVYVAVDLPPKFPGGEAKFNEFLKKTLKYPSVAKENNVTGRAFVSFIVEQDGSLSDIKIVRNPGSGLGEEAARIFSLSPKWIPGIQKGKVVRVAYTIPVNFAL